MASVRASAKRYYDVILQPLSLWIVSYHHITICMHACVHITLNRLDHDALLYK